MYLGIDVGGTKIKIAFFKKGITIKPDSFLVIKTPKTKDGFFQEIYQACSSILQNKRLSEMGIGIPGIVHPKTIEIIKTPNVPYLEGIDVKKHFGKLASNILIDNDSRCFLRAEAELGAGRNYCNIVALTIGTGIGGGIMVDRKIIFGTHDGAGEFGHTVIHFPDQTFEKLGAKKAYLKYGDRSKIIGIGIANVINILDPDIVILGGGGVVRKKVRLPIVHATAKKYIVSPLGKTTPIVSGELREYAQAIGAALLCTLHVNII